MFVDIVTGIIVGASLYRLILAVVCHGWPKRDATDAEKPGPRSGLSVYVDHGTGIEYIATPEGGLTPRLK